MNKNRMETLKANGIDTGRFFTLTVNETIPAGTKINISIEGNEVSKQILEDGYVKNTRLHRRFVAAQYMRMLNSDEGWNGYLNYRYGYMYTFDMMLEEVRVLAHLEKVDAATFNERKQFFTKEVVCKVLDDYYTSMIDYISGLPKKNCKGKPYVSIKKYGNVFVNDIVLNICGPVSTRIGTCKGSRNYTELYNNMIALERVMIKLPYQYKKSKTWVDAFQKEGAFYTLKNLIMFHGVKLVYNDRMYQDAETSMVALNEIVRKYKGYQMNAMLKCTIEVNNFDFARSVAAHN